MALSDSWFMEAVRILEKYGGLHQFAEDGFDGYSVTIFLITPPRSIGEKAVSLIDAFELAQKAVSELAEHCTISKVRFEYGSSFWTPAESRLELTVRKGKTR